MQLKLTILVFVLSLTFSYTWSQPVVTNPEPRRTPDTIRTNASAVPDRGYTSTYIKQKTINLHGNYIGIGSSYLVGLGQFAPYRRGGSINITDGIPILKSKGLIDLSFSSDFLFRASNDWYSEAYNLRSVSGVTTGFYDKITAGLMQVVFDRKDNCLTVGAFGGIEYIRMGVPKDTNIKTGTPKNTSLSPLVGGFKVNCYVDKNFFLFAQVTFTNVTAVIVDNHSMGNLLDAKFNTINIGGAYKLNFF